MLICTGIHSLVINAFKIQHCGQLIAQLSESRQSIVFRTLDREYLGHVSDGVDRFSSSNPVKE